MNKRHMFVHVAAVVGLENSALPTPVTGTLGTSHVRAAPQVGSQYLAVWTRLGIGKKCAGEHFFGEILLFRQLIELNFLLAFLANEILQLRNTFSASPLHDKSYLPALGAPGVVPVGSQAQLRAVAATMSNDSACLMIVLRQNFVLWSSTTKWTQVVARNEKLAGEILLVPLRQTFAATSVPTLATSRSQFLYCHVFET